MENLDKYDLEGEFLHKRKNEHYPLYGGYQRELDYPIKPSYGISIKVMTEKELNKEKTQKEEIKLLNQKLKYYKDEYNTRDKIVYEIPDYKNYFYDLPFNDPQLSVFFLIK
jgi:hypothetical protein